MPGLGWPEWSWHGLWKRSQRDARKSPVDITCHVVTAHAGPVLGDSAGSFQGGNGNRAISFFVCGKSIKGRKKKKKKKIFH